MTGAGHPGPSWAAGQVPRYFQERRRSHHRPFCPAMEKDIARAQLRASFQRAVKRQSLHLGPAVGRELEQLLDVAILPLRACAQESPRELGVSQPAAVVDPACRPERLPAQPAVHDHREQVPVRHPVPVAIQHHLCNRASVTQVQEEAHGAAHVRLVDAVVRLVDTADEADVGVRRQPQVHLHVGRTWKGRVVPTHTLLQRGTDNDLR